VGVLYTCSFHSQQYRQRLPSPLKEREGFPKGVTDFAIKYTVLYNVQYIQYVVALIHTDPNPDGIRM
jgi:hypothetical protein